jgi:amino acid transporter
MVCENSFSPFFTYHQLGAFFTTGRLIYVAAKEGYLPALFGHLHSTRQTPINAMLLQAVITIIFIMLGGGFRSLINFAVVATWAFYFLTVLGLVILRVKEPGLARYLSRLRYYC